LVSRLDYGYKKVDLAIKAFNKLDYPLIIVGTGREEAKLKKMAGDNITFAGRVSEKCSVNFTRGKGTYYASGRGFRNCCS